MSDGGSVARRVVTASKELLVTAYSRCQPLTSRTRVMTRWRRFTSISGCPRRHGPCRECPRNKPRPVDLPRHTGGATSARPRVHSRDCERGSCLNASTHIAAYDRERRQPDLAWTTAPRCGFGLTTRLASSATATFSIRWATSAFQARQSMIGSRVFVRRSMPLAPWTPCPRGFLVDRVRRWDSNRLRRAARGTVAGGRAPFAGCDQGWPLRRRR